MAQKSHSKSPFRKGSSREPRYFTDKAFGGVCPILYQWMTSICDDEGEIRDLCSVTFSVKDGRLKAMIADPNTKEVSFVTLEAFDGCWLKIENAIAEDQLEWIQKRQQHRSPPETSRNGMATDSSGRYTENIHSRQ